MKVKSPLKNAITLLKSDFKVGKTPGTDGFPAEFYRFFMPEIHKEMTESFNFAFQSRNLSIS